MRTRIPCIHSSCRHRPQRLPCGGSSRQYRRLMSHASSGPAEPNAAALIEPTGTITPVDALALALMHNPGLKTFAYSCGRRKPACFRPGLRPNPQLEIELEEFGRSGETKRAFDAAERRSRSPALRAWRQANQGEPAVAAITRNWCNGTTNRRVWILARDVSKAFTAVMAAQERLALAEKASQVVTGRRSRQLPSVSKPGRDSPVDEMRANVALSESRIVRQKAEKALAATRRNLGGDVGQQRAGVRRR